MRDGADEVEESWSGKYCFLRGIVATKEIDEVLGLAESDALDSGEEVQMGDRRK